MYTNFTELTSSREEVFLASEQTCVFKRLDLLRGDRSKRNQSKYYQYHKDVSHATKECVMLKDEIKNLIRNGYLQDYVSDRKAKPRNDQNEVKPSREIRTIFGRLHFAGETRGAQNHYVRKAKEKPLTNIVSLNKRPAKQFREEVDNITFSDRDAHHIRHPHCDALVIMAMEANNIHNILVDNGSSVDILYYQEFQKMGLKVNNLKPLSNPIYDFTGDSVTFRCNGRVPKTILCDGRFSSD